MSGNLTGLCLYINDDEKKKKKKVFNYFNVSSSRVICKMKILSNLITMPKWGLSKKATCLHGRVAEWPLGRNYFTIYIKV